MSYAIKNQMVKNNNRDLPDIFWKNWMCLESEPEILVVNSAASQRYKVCKCDLPNMLKRRGFTVISDVRNEWTDLQTSYKPAGSACNLLFLLR